MVLLAALVIGAMIVLVASRGVDHPQPADQLESDDEDESGNSDVESQPCMTRDDRVTVGDIATGTFLGGCLLMVASVVLLLLASLLGFARVIAWLRDAGFFAP